jgi:hypothetical protein
MSTVILTVGFQYVAVPYSAKLVEALMELQTKGFRVDSIYESYTDVRFVKDLDGSPIEIKIVPSEIVSLTRPEAPVRPAEPVNEAA